MKNEHILDIKNLFFSYSNDPKDIILENISLSIQKNEIVGILGPNGCGKTTLINLISGFITPTKGSIKRNLIEKNNFFSSLIFQEIALLDWKRVRDNIGLSLISSNLNQEEENRIINDMIKLLKLTDHESKFPQQLSGGLKQRVAIARALAPNPSLLLMDEPFSALDIKTKEILMKDIKKILLDNTKLNTSAIFITHNIEEALFFCDRIILINPLLKNIKEIATHKKENLEKAKCQMSEIEKYLKSLE